MSTAGGDPRERARANADVAELRCEEAERYRKAATIAKADADLYRASVATAPTSSESFERLAQADVMHARAVELTELARRQTVKAYQAMKVAYEILAGIR